jgi:hypothetical protein
MARRSRKRWHQDQARTEECLNLEQNWENRLLVDFAKEIMQDNCARKDKTMIGRNIYSGISSIAAGP